LTNIKKAENATKSYFFACGIAFSTWASRIPEIKEKLLLNDAEFGTILLGMPLGSLVALPISGLIIDKFGSKNIVFLSCLIYVVSLPALGLSGSGFQLALALFLYGFGGDMLNISMNVQAVGVEKAQKRSFMNVFHAIFSTGLMIGAALGGLVSKIEISPLIHFSIIGILIGILGLIGKQFLLFQDQSPSEPQPIFAWPDKSMIILGIICLCGMLSEGAMADWSVIYYKQILKNPTGYVTAGFTAFSIFMVVGRFLGDKLVERWGLAKLLLINSLLVVLGMSIALSTTYPVLVILGFGFTGLGLSTIVPLIYSEAGHSKTMSPGVALAAITTLGMTGFMAGPVLIGYISEFSTLRSALSLLIILGIISAFFTRKIR
jgi:MFS family permease